LRCAAPGVVIVFEVCEALTSKKVVIRRRILGN